MVGRRFQSRENDRDRLGLRAVVAQMTDPGGSVMAIPATRFGERLSAARDATQDHGASALLIGVGPQLRWLTGYAARPLERLTMLVLPVDGPATLVVPRLERAPAQGSPAGAAGLVEVVSWDETDDPIERVAASLPAGADAGRLLLSDHLWAMHALALQARFAGATLGLAERGAGRAACHQGCR